MFLKNNLKVLITTVPFGSIDSAPVDLLVQNGINFDINPIGRKLTSCELASLVPSYDILIAGTEEINVEVLNAGKRLKLISRVGIGVDAIDLCVAKELGVKVSYTPDAPASAVSELTLALMLSGLRSVHTANEEIHSSKWIRHFGKRLGESTVGIIGFGRIGQKVAKHLTGFSPKQILVNDISSTTQAVGVEKLKIVQKEEIYRSADVITLHLPLTPDTKNLITQKELKIMKPGVIIVNTSRGGIINEQDLFHAVKGGQIGCAAIDVFEEEPYFGPLASSAGCLLTAHMGSMSEDCRLRMELEATDEVVRFCRGEPLKSEVPSIEYSMRKQQH